MPPIDLNSTVVASADQATADLEDEVVIFHIVRQEYFRLNEVSGRIWSMIQEPRRVDAVRDALLQKYPDVEPGVCTQDLIEVLGELAGLGLVDLVAADPEDAAPA
jgi:hypothetical protein